MIKCGYIDALCDALIRYDSCSDQSLGEKVFVGRKLKVDSSRTPLLYICCPETFISGFFQDWLKSKLNFVDAIVLDEVCISLRC